MDRFNRRFDKAFKEMEHQMGRMMRSMSSMVSVHAHGTWRPSVDVYETEEGLVAFVDAAGVDPDTLSVIAGRGKITVAGERCMQCQDDIRSVHQLEIDQGRFNRTIHLPYAVDVEAVSSAFRNGILEIKLPREKSHEKVRIRVDQGDNS